MWETKRGYKRPNPWERNPPLVQDYSTLELPDDLTSWDPKRPKFAQRGDNEHLKVSTKRAALKAAPAVVALKSFSGGEQLNQCSGTIIEADSDNVVTVITSSNLIRRPLLGTEEDDENLPANDLKVIVIACNGESYEGNICVFDFHMNLMIIRFRATSAFSSIRVRHVDDSINLNDSEVKPSFLRPHSNIFHLVPETEMVAIGRYFIRPFGLMAAPGIFSLDRCNYDCKELFMSTCAITECGDGGPIVNLSGEMIGVAFYDTVSPHSCQRTLFSSGGTATKSLADLEIAERIIQNFPSISKGVVVEKVTPGSAAESAGLRRDDVIIRCDGRPIGSYLELLRNIWDKVGRFLELEVARVNHVTLLQLKMLVAEVDSNDLYSWPCNS